MKQSRRFGLCLIPVIMIISCRITEHRVSGKSAVESGPRLEVADPIDLGEIKQGEVAEYMIGFSNVGTDELRIDEVETSCGCTVVDLSSKILAPGEKGEFKLTLDTFGKKGKIDKTITFFSNDYLEPEKTIHALAQVKAPKHPDFDVGETLFSSKCRSCHADSGKGLIGLSLYSAICYQCHGVEGEGNSASALSDPDYLSNVDREYLYEWIAEGERGTAMPGYSQKNGGPLTERQLNSLVDFILEWR